MRPVLLTSLLCRAHANASAHATHALRIVLEDHRHLRRHRALRLLIRHLHSWNRGRGSAPSPRLRRNGLGASPRPGHWQGRAIWRPRCPGQIASRSCGAGSGLIRLAKCAGRSLGCSWGSGGLLRRSGSLHTGDRAASKIGAFLIRVPVPVLPGLLPTREVRTLRELPRLGVFSIGLLRREALLSEVRVLPGIPTMLFLERFQPCNICLCHCRPHLRGCAGCRPDRGGRGRGCFRRRCGGRFLHHGSRLGNLARGIHRLALQLVEPDQPLLPLLVRGRVAVGLVHQELEQRVVLYRIAQFLRADLVFQGKVGVPEIVFALAGLQLGNGRGFRKLRAISPLRGF